MFGETFFLFLRRFMYKPKIYYELTNWDGTKKNTGWGR